MNVDTGVFQGTLLRGIFSLSEKMSILFLSVFIMHIILLIKNVTSRPELRYTIYV